MSYINPITCENAWLSFEDILRLVAGSGYVKTYGDVDGSVGVCDEFQDGVDEWKICCGNDGELEVYYGTTIIWSAW